MHWVEKHPDTGIVFADAPLLPYAKIVEEEAVRLHGNLPYADTICWDLTYDEDGRVVVIEYNLRGFGVIYQQAFHGPYLERKPKNGLKICGRCGSMQMLKAVIIHLFQSYRPNRNRRKKELTASMKWTPKEAKQAQNERLSETLKYCLTEIPYYRDRVKLNPDAITAKTAEKSLTFFPVLTAGELKANFEDLQCDPRPKGAFLNRSGGTTGQPTVFYLDPISEDWVRGTKRFHARQAGLSSSDRKWVIWGSQEEYQQQKLSRKARFAAWVRNVQLFKGFSLSNEELDALLDGLSKQPPALVGCYADIADRLAERAQATKRTMPELRFMVTAGTLYAPMRKRIERVFGNHLFNCYGSREFGDLALSCSKSAGMHIVGLSHYLEIVDEAGNGLPDEETGEILITSLANRTMPLVRYAIKDRGSLTKEPCACGNPWPRLKEVEGRSQDLFYAPNGCKISPNAMVHFCWAYGTEYNTRVQIVQRDYDRLEVHLLKIENKQQKNEEFEEKMRSELETLFRVPLSIDIIWKEEMDYAPTGKYRMIQRRMEADS